MRSSSFKPSVRQTPRPALGSKIDLPRLCVYHADPSQYYPCVLNYIGLNSWSLYRCPNLSTFDEQSQQCLVKIPIDDSFEQLASYQSTSSIQFFRLASFILATPATSEESVLQQERRLVSLPPITEQLIETMPKRKRLPKVSETCEGGEFCEDCLPSVLNGKHWTVHQE